MVKVIWHGHACFELQGEKVTVIIDPFKGVGIPDPKAAADIVLCTHSHQDHNNINAVIGEQGETLEGFIGSKNIKGIPIKGIASFHDDAKGSKRGRNSIYAFTLDGLQFCHLGDLGHELTHLTIDEIGDVDVLFVPIGGFFTIDPDTATKICEQLNPKIAIPMHYRMPEMHAMFDQLKTVDDFLMGKANVERAKGPTVNIEKDKLPKRLTILVFSLKHA